MSKNDRTGSIRIFLAVCGAQSFAAAATQLHLSPSAVAKAIARLEARLGVRLLERTTRRLQLTQEGERYLSVCRQALDEIDEVEAELAATRTEPSGLVRISLPPLFGMSVIAPALFALADAYPCCPSTSHSKARRSIFWRSRWIWPSGLAILPTHPD